MIILTPNDFKSGFYKIPFTQYTQAALQESIELYEVEALACLLGVELSELFIADLIDGVPQDARFTVIFDSFMKEINCIKCRSFGIKVFLKGYIYYHHMNQRNRVQTEGGNVSNSKENSNLLTFENNERDAEKRFNASKFTADCIQLYICDNSATYPEYEGQKLIIKYTSLI